jgi:hypothetical protein
MFPRAEAAARESASNLVDCFEPGGPARLLARMAA